MKQKNKKGISLIVLVITIIIMIILAAAIILSLSNSGIIGNAKEAVAASDIATARNLVAMGNAEWELMSESRREEYSNSKKTFIEEYFKNNGIDLDKMGDYHIDQDGNLKTVFLADNVKISNYIKYTPQKPVGSTTIAALSSSSQTIYSQDLSNIGWRVLGIEDGSVLITTAQPLYVGNSSALCTLYGKKGYANLISELNRICSELYGGGSGADLARSISVEDINKITGYKVDKAEYMDKNWTNQKIAYGTKLGDLMSQTGSVLYFNDVPEPGKSIQDYAMTSYFYSAKDQMGNNTSEQYKMLFRNTDNTSDVDYWLPSYSDSANFGDGYVDFGVKLVADGRVTGRGLFVGGYIEEMYSQRIRPVIKIKADAKIKNDAKNGLTLENAYIFE